jgi:hypothetical protein
MGEVLFLLDMKLCCLLVVDYLLRSFRCRLHIHFEWSRPSVLWCEKDKRVSLSLLNMPVFEARCRVAACGGCLRLLVKHKIAECLFALLRTFKTRLLRLTVLIIRPIHHWFLSWWWCCVGLLCVIIEWPHMATFLERCPLVPGWLIDWVEVMVGGLIIGGRSWRRLSEQVIIAFLLMRVPLRCRSTLQSQGQSVYDLFYRHLRGLWKISIIQA